jgi:hypothetical protein
LHNEHLSIRTEHFPHPLQSFKAGSVDAIVCCESPAARRVKMLNKSLKALGITYVVVVVALICASQRSKLNGHIISLEEYALTPIEGLDAGQRGLRQIMLWGGEGKVTTSSSVDGRKTVPGLRTDCIPGVLHSDCSPQQEDGAWSKEAEQFLDKRTGGAHSKSMQAIQADIDAGYAAREKFLNDCLKDASLCSGRRTDSRSGIAFDLHCITALHTWHMTALHIVYNRAGPKKIELFPRAIPTPRFICFLDLICWDAASQHACRATTATLPPGELGRILGLRSRALITDSTITTAAGLTSPCRRVPKVPSRSQRS